MIWFPSPDEREELVFGLALVHHVSVVPREERIGGVPTLGRISEVVEIDPTGFPQGAVPHEDVDHAVVVIRNEIAIRGAEANEAAVPLCSPAFLTVAVSSSELDQFTLGVRSEDEPSEYSPHA
jgi:hypothetical protein